MNKRAALEILFAKHGFAEFKFIMPESIVVANWVRMKCMFGCPNFGKRACCPPNVPSVAECREFINEYNLIALFHLVKAVDDPEDRKPWIKQVNESFLTLEREVFLAGNHKAFLLFLGTCRHCPECVESRAKCINSPSGRPTPEALAIDVFGTARQCGYPIDVLSDFSQPMNRYAFLLIE